MSEQKAANAESAGRVVLITGASRGCGLAAARQFAARGDRVVLAARSTEALRVAADEIKAAGGRAWSWAGDLQSAAACAELVQWVSVEVGVPDIVVLAAGVGHWGAMTDMSDDLWQETRQINIDGVFFLTRAAVRQMLARGSGHLVFVSSVMARRGVPNMAAYAASKAAVATFADSLSTELKPAGLKVTTVYPGTTATSMRDHQEAQGRPLTRDITDPTLQLSPEDVSEAIVWATSLSPTAYPTGVFLEPRGV
jgi:NAD(P)-dependent dehydrogenase (short-subunit alcohol dehydrogenase family)